MHTIKKDGRSLPETQDMKAWREEFSQMSLEDHDKVLKHLGLDEGDIEEFNIAEKGGKKLEDLLGVSDEVDGTDPEKAPKPKRTK